MAKLCILWLLVIALLAAVAARPCGASRLLRAGSLVPSGVDELDDKGPRKGHVKHEYFERDFEAYADIDDTGELEVLREDLDSCFESISQRRDSPRHRGTRCTRMLHDYDDTTRHKNSKRNN